MGVYRRPSRIIVSPDVGPAVFDAVSLPPIVGDFLFGLPHTGHNLFKEAHSITVRCYAGESVITRGRGPNGDGHS